MTKLVLFLFVIFLHTSVPLFANTVKSKKVTKEAKIPKELVPYQILIEINYENSPLITKEFKAHLNSELLNHINNVYGPSWNTHISSDLTVLQSRELDRINTKQLIQSKSLLKKYDKFFFLTVNLSGASYIVSGKEWDIATRELSEIYSNQCYQRKEISLTLLKSIHALFRPLFIIDRVEHNAVYLRAFAGELVPQNQILSNNTSLNKNISFLNPYQIQPGSMLVSYYRYFDKKKEIKKIQPITWTYLYVNQIKRATVEASIISGLRTPLSTKRLRRVELVAMMLKPLVPESQITFYPIKNRTLPFAGLKVRLERKLNRKDEAKPKPEIIWTDREGRITIPKGSQDSPVSWIYALSGDALIARVPYVPGVHKHIEFEIPDDTVRLSVEGEMALLESDLIISVTKRTILFGRVKRLLLDDKWNQIEVILNELDKLEKPEFYKRQLTNIRVNAVEKSGKNRKNINRIKKLCENMEKLINRYIDPEKIREFQIEVRSLKSEKGDFVKKWLKDQKDKDQKSKKKAQ